MSENIVGRPRRKPASPPERIVAPPQKRIGVASAIWSQFPQAPPARAINRGKSPSAAWPAPWPAIPAIATPMSITASAPQIHNRRRSAATVATSAASTPIGSSGIPQIGQAPGSDLVTCGCIGQVQPSSPMSALAQHGLTVAADDTAAGLPPEPPQQEPAAVVLDPRGTSVTGVGDVPPPQHDFSAAEGALSGSTSSPGAVADGERRGLIRMRSDSIGLAF